MNGNDDGERISRAEQSKFCSTLFKSFNNRLRLTTTSRFKSDKLHLLVANNDSISSMYFFPFNLRSPSLSKTKLYNTVSLRTQRTLCTSSTEMSSISFCNKFFVTILASTFVDVHGLNRVSTSNLHENSTRRPNLLQKGPNGKPSTRPSVEQVRPIKAKQVCIAGELVLCA